MGEKKPSVPWTEDNRKNLFPHSSSLGERGIGGAGGGAKKSTTYLKLGTPVGGNVMIGTNTRGKICLRQGEKSPICQGRDLKNIIDYKTRATHTAEKKRPSSTKGRFRGPRPPRIPEGSGGGGDEQGNSSRE